MGRPLRNSWFGLPIGPGSGHITVNGVRFKDGTTSTNAYIVKQTGSSAYIVQDAAQTHAAEIVFLANASSVGTLSPGQCFILATPYGGSPLPCSKISQFRLSVYSGSTIVDYSWSTIPATALGQADLIKTGPVGEIVQANITNAGYGYTSVPSVAFTGGGSGATATATISNGVVTAITVTAAGSGYTSGTMTLDAPPAASTATAGTVTLVSNAITAIAVATGGGYYTTAPQVTVTNGGGSGAIIAAVLTNGAVTSFTVTNGGSGYTSSPTVTVAAPPASITATATAIVS